MRKLGVISLAAAGLVALLLAGCSREGSDWKSAQAADTGEAYQEFLRQHPNSNNAVQAQTRIKQLAEDRDWQQASSADTRDAYEQFVAQHADSKWAQEARIRIENFAQGGTTGVPAAAGSPPDVAGAPAASPGLTPPPASAPTAPAPAPAKTASSSKPATHAAKSKTATKPSAKSTQVASAGGHYVQLGAFSSKARAESQWKVLQTKFPSQLAALKPRYVSGKAQAKPVVRLQVALPSSERARELCGALKKHSQACVPVAL